LSDLDCLVHSSHTYGVDFAAFLSVHMPSAIEILGVAKRTRWMMVWY
jgi:hypothetical protein